MHHTPIKHQSSKLQEMSPIDKLKSVKGEAHQGNYLINAKERHSEKKNQHQLSQSLQRKSTSQHGSRFQGVAGGQTAAAAALAANRQYTYGSTTASKGLNQYIQHANTITNQ